MRIARVFNYFSALFALTDFGQGIFGLGNILTVFVSMDLIILRNLLMTGWTIRMDWSFIMAVRTERLPSASSSF